jgi:hypothetical protein
MVMGLMLELVMESKSVQVTELAMVLKSAKELEWG